MDRREFVRSLGVSAIVSRCAASEKWACLPGVDAAALPEDQKSGLIGEIEALGSPTGTYELCEFRVPVHGERVRGLNPFRQTEIALDAEFISPSGKLSRVPGFFAEDHSSIDTGAAPIEQSAGWRVRFSGSEAGRYTGRVELRVRGELAASQTLPPFTLQGSHHPGTIRISKNASRYLEHDDGSCYFPIGQNVCWTTDVSRLIPGAKLSSPTLELVESYTRWFGRMGENSANWARIFMKPIFYLEPGEPWAWDQEKAAHFDSILDLARKNGISICLCFNPERNDDGAIYEGSMDLFRASNTAWGRLLASQQLGFEQFFTNSMCQEMYRDKIRYIVGRWGYSPHIFAWELWNEIEAVDPKEGTYDWMREMTAYLRSIDPWHHLIKSSAHHAWSPEFWGENSGDLNDVHPYFGWSGWEGTRNLGAFLPEFSSGLYATGRPFIIGETGIAREVTTPLGLAGDLADKDVSCFHVHEALWGGLFSGSVGSGMVWWWDENVDLHNGYFRFRNLANFVADVEFNHEGFARGNQAASSTDQLRLFELIGHHTRLLWLRHRDLSWYAQAVEKKIPAPVHAATLTLSGLSEPAYLVEYWSSKDGKLLSSTHIQANESSLVIPLGEVSGEIALKVRPLRNVR